MSFFLINDIRLNLPMGWVPFQLLYLGPFSNVRCTLLSIHLFKSEETLALLGGERDVNGVYLADSVPLPYLFGKQAEQSTAEFDSGRPAVFAMLGIGESGAVNITILVARQPFLLRLTGLCN